MARAGLEDEVASSADLPPGPSRETPGLQPGSAPRGTLLAAERTYLAWLRTGMGSLGLAIAVGRIAPALLI